MISYKHKHMQCEKTMKTDFFTLGGMQFWGDIFLYKNWKIQFNSLNNKYRLLDSQNIRRCSGSFDKCLKAFHHYKNVYQMQKQNNHIVIMIHGLAGTRFRFKKLCNELNSNDIFAETINYPSTRAEFVANTKQIETALNSLEDVKEVSFITHGIGGLIIRELLNSDAIWLKNIKVKRIVQINPPNQNERLWNKMKQFAPIRYILGPMLKQCDSKNITKVATFPKNIQFGILCTHNPFVNKIVSIFPDSWQKLMFKKDDAFLVGAKDALNIKIWGINSCSNAKVTKACINFLKTGSFGI